METFRWATFRKLPTRSKESLTSTGLSANAGDMPESHQRRSDRAKTRRSEIQAAILPQSCPILTTKRRTSTITNLHQFRRRGPKGSFRRNARFTGEHHSLFASHEHLRRRLFHTRRTASRQAARQALGSSTIMLLTITSSTLRGGSRRPS